MVELIIDSDDDYCCKLFQLCTSGEESFLRLL